MMTFLPSRNSGSEPLLLGLAVGTGAALALVLALALDFAGALALAGALAFFLGF
jgi:hypothetical protein